MMSGCVQSGDLLAEWERRFVADPAKANRDLLVEALALFEREIANELSAESARAGVRLYYELGKVPEAVDLLRRFLAGDPAPEDEFWARWELVDHLAMLRRCKEAVDMHRDFLRWARERFRPERLLTVMSDGTQALCWDEAGVGDEWLEHFETISRDAPARADTRLERFYYIRTAAGLLKTMGRHARALDVGERVQRLAREDPSWKDAWWTEIEGRIMRVDALGATRSPELVEVASTTADLIHATDTIVVGPETAPRLRSLYHNLAAALYFAHEYRLAIPLFERAIDLGILVPHAYAWLAACLCTTGAGRTRLGPLIEAAALRWQGASVVGVIESTPELRRCVEADKASV